MTDRPLFSIIVVSYNASTLIRDTINSISEQTFDGYEIIIKDACSEDDTIDRIPHSDKIRLFRSRDAGIYDGMNMAIREANGRFLHFLNCGDVFSDENVLQRTAAHIEKNNIDGGIVYGNCMMGGELRKQPSDITPFFLYRTPLCHQSMFFSKSVFDEGGLYDLSYKIVADYDCTLKAFKSGTRFSYINIPVCDYLGGGVSETEAGIRTKEREYRQIHKIYYSTFERLLYETVLILSMRKLRYRILSGKGPRWLRNLYKKTVYRINR